MAGDYTIEATVIIDGSIEILAASFSVMPISNISANISLIPSKIKELKFLVRNNKNEKIDSVIKIYGKEGNLIREIKEKKALRLLQARVAEEGEVGTGEYDVEVALENIQIKKIVFKNLKIKNDSLDLGIDDVSVDKISIENIKNEKIVSAFAINPTNLNFSNATITTIAKGTALWKCKDWNFSEQKCYGNWEKIRDLVPGEEYNITLTLEDPGYAETGLVTINTKKAIYHVNESAEITMVVLDTAGHLVSNANISLQVANPNNVLTYYYTSDNRFFV